MRWSAEVEYTGAFGEELVRLKLAAVADRWGAGLVDFIDAGRVAIRLEAEADDLVRAIHLTLVQFGNELHRAGFDVRPIAFRVFPAEQPGLLARVLGVSEIAKMFRFSRQRASELSRRARHPAPVARLGAGAVYGRSEIIIFHRARLNVRGSIPLWPPRESDDR